MVDIINFIEFIITSFLECFSAVIFSRTPEQKSLMAAWHKLESDQDMISRRDLLKLVPAVMASNLVTILEPHDPNLKTDKSFHGTNLAGWNVVLGDALYVRAGEPPVTLADIETLHPTSRFSELRANINRRVIMAHNITFKRVIDPFARNYIHTATFKFRLPYIPTNDNNALWHGQTLEAGISIWDGAASRLDYGLAFQWDLNPWNEFGKFRVWTGQTGAGKWVNNGSSLTPDTNWHQAMILVDFKRENTDLIIDGKRHLSSFFKTTRPAAWGKEVAARFQVEIVSIYPEPSGIKAAHRAQFKDWTWLWNTA